MIDQGLVDDTRARMRHAWRTGGSGTLQVGPHYVQWAKFDAGLQVECVSNAFLAPEDRLSAEQEDALRSLWFREPECRWPNHFRRFRRKRDLFDAAVVLARVVDEVLGTLPFVHGQVVLLAPDADCPAEVLLAHAEELRGPRSTVVVAGGVGTGDALQDSDWLRLRTVEAPPVLASLFVPGAPLRRDLVRSVRRLRELGRHVVVVAPQADQASLRDLAGRVANRVVVVGLPEIEERC